ncbi:MAG TPA: tetratricopeptide repeat protein [Dysgonamonadaceae bacterium]|nr:tetratricopeptide repeat protein [Dysgonamonadaceae bacterium]
MKIKSLILLISLLSVFSTSAQKAVRKNIRQGNRAYNEQKYEEASKHYEEAIKINPNASEANYNMGNTLYRMNEWEKAIEQQNHYLMLENEDREKVSSSWHNIGNAFLHKKDLEKSMEAYKMALRANPNDDETRYNLAVVQKMINDEEQEQDDQQDQNQNQDQNNQPQPPEPQDKPKKPEEQTEPEQMSRENARQILQAIEQDEKETQKRLNEMKAEERKKQAEENRQQNKDW